MFWLSNKPSKQLFNYDISAESCSPCDVADMTSDQQNADVHSALISWQTATVQLLYWVTLFDYINQIPHCLHKESNSWRWQRRTVTLFSHGCSIFFFYTLEIGGSLFKREAIMSLNNPVDKVTVIGLDNHCPGQAAN